MKKVILVHRWEGNPNNCWFPWLKKELEKMKFKVTALKMPNPEEPKIKEWVEFMQKNIKNVDQETYFVGHSIGCQTIMRYLETLDGKTKIGGLIFVAGFFNLPNLETEEEREIAKSWLETKINTDKIKLMTNHIVAIFSDNDPFVPLEDTKLFKKRLNAEIIIKKNKGHFSDDAGIIKLPVVIEQIKKWQT